MQTDNRQDAAWQCVPGWRVWVTIRGRPHIRAVADIAHVPNARDAVAVVMNEWTYDDWDTEAFAYVDKEGNWRYWRLRATDQIVVERVERVYDC